MKELFRRIVREDDGSAVVEFVALALPLFIPLFIFLNQYALQSDTESSLRTLSREMARAFVTSENDEVADQVVYEVFVKGGNLLGFSDDLASGDLDYRYECATTPCISPNNKIEITLHSRKANRTVTSLEYVSPWA
jgi:hypothetical protein